jgi:hypothetical protein
MRGVALRIVAGLLLLIAASELFLCCSAMPAAKALELCLALLGVVLISWPARLPGVNLVRCAAGSLFVLFVVQAAWRYPGLLKVEGDEFDWIDVAALAIEAGALFGVSCFVATMVFRIVRRTKAAD